MPRLMSLRSSNDKIIIVDEGIFPNSFLRYLHQGKRVEDGARLKPGSQGINQHETVVVFSENEE